jgi:hypothetical protein
VKCCTAFHLCCCRYSSLRFCGYRVPSARDHPIPCWDAQAKPPIDDFLRNIMCAAGNKSEARAGGAAVVQLEVFARNLRRGWLSVGLEPLKHQELGPFMQAV